MPPLVALHVDCDALLTPPLETTTTTLRGNVSFLTDLADDGPAALTHFNVSVFPLHELQFCGIPHLVNPQMVCMGKERLALLDVLQPAGTVDASVGWQSGCPIQLQPEPGNMHVNRRPSLSAAVWEFDALVRETRSAYPYPARVSSHLCPRRNRIVRPTALGCRPGEPCLWSYWTPTKARLLINCLP